mgnify:CR=1 FL=1
MVTIYFDTENLFSGISPTPFVGRSAAPVAAGDRWAMADSIDLQGTISGQCSTFAELVNLENTLLSRLNKSHRHFGIYDTTFGDVVTNTEIEPTPSAATIIHTDGNISNYKVNQFVELSGVSGVPRGIYKILSKGAGTLTIDHFDTPQSSGVFPSSRVIRPALEYDIARITDISFNDSSYIDLVPFSIRVQAFQSGLFSGTYGVLDPVDRFEFNEKPDGGVEITHTISARGINTTTGASNAMQNAIDYVHGLTGWSSQVTPALISNMKVAGGLPILIESNGSINRFDGSYSVVESWVTDTYATGVTGLVRFITDMSSGDNGLVNVRVDGSIMGGRNFNISELRNSYGALAPYTICNSAYKNFFGGDLNTTILSKSADEDDQKNRIDFSFAYDNDTRPNPFLKETTAISKNEITDRHTMTYTANVSARGEYSTRWSKVEAFYNAQDFETNAASKWTTFGYGTTLKPKPARKRVSENEYAATKTISLTYEDGLEVPEGLEQWDYNISVIPAFQQYAARPILDGLGAYTVFDLGFKNRARYSIDGIAQIKKDVATSDGLNIIVNELNFLSQTIAIGSKKLLDLATLSSGEAPFDRGVRFSYSWSAETSGIFMQ